jgi:hypothetical protein
MNRAQSQLAVIKPAFLRLSIQEEFSMLAVLILALAATASAAQNTASGTLTIGKDAFEMKYAAATLTKDGTRVVLADKPIPVDLLDDESQIWDLKTQGFHGLQIDIAQDKENYSLFVISATLQGTRSHSGTLDAKRLTVFTKQRVEGSFEAAPDEIGGTSVGYSVKFASDVIPPEAAPTPADAAAAAGKGSTAVYLALVAAIRSGDKQKIIDLAPPDKRAAIDTPQFPEILKMVQMMTPTDIKVLKATETGDHAKLIARGMDDGKPQRGKIYLNRVDGKWIMASESWGSEK